LLKEHGILPHWQWIPRDLNELAELWSKYRDPSDWTLTESWFAHLNRLWAPHTVDRMASATNSRLPRFYSRFYSAGMEGLDCFSVIDWSEEINLINRFQHDRTRD
jgi:hypothetical protein